MRYKVGMVSLGCDKNRVDSEAMLGILKDSGYEIVSNEKEADVIIVNTCGFIESAKEESIEVVLEMAKNKVDGNCKAVVVTGCMAQRYSDELIKEMPEIDAVIGVASYKNIGEVIKRTIEKKTKTVMLDELNNKLNYERRILTTPSHYAYVKIAEGCNNNCSYCIIPKLRGRFRSKSIEDILKEVRELTLQGVKEIILVAQDTTMYGIDLYKKKMLPELLKEIEKIEGVDWIRILYSYPEEIDDKLIDTIKESKKVCHYFDIPLQHISNKVLKSMNRRNTKEDTIKLIEKLRFEIPDVILRTSIIVGYPGEDAEAFTELKNFIKDYKLDRVGIFTYSREEGTKAADMPEQVEEALKHKRRDELMAIQNNISHEKNKLLVNKHIHVIIDSIKDKNTYYGRSYGDAPEIDQQVIINSPDKELKKGDTVKVNIRKAYTYDLLGDVDYEFSK